MATILDGRALSARIRDKVKAMISQLPATPGMAAILVGDDPASHLYVSLKEKACADVGIHFEKFLYPADEPTEEIVKKIAELNKRKDIHGILVQFPLPTQNAETIIAALDPDKDIDGFHPESLRRLEAGVPGLVAPVALGVMKLVDSAGRNLPGLKAALVCSEIFARPLKALLQEQQVTLVEETTAADIIIIAVGRPRMLKAADIKDGAIIIDVGTTKTAEGLLGDVDFASVSGKAGAITPVPGGVGPTTVAMLVLNVVKAFQLQRS